MATIQSGSTGNDVKKLQEQLNQAVGKKLLKTDGKFGPKTEKALKDWQKSNRMKVTGVADAKTTSALANASKSSKSDDAAAPAAKVSGVTIKVGGKTEEMTKADYETGKKVILKNLKRGLLVAIQNRASECRIMYDHFVALNDDQYVVSWLVEATSGAKLPPASTISNAEAAAKAVEAAINSGDMVKIKKALEVCEKPINGAVDAMRTYQKKVIGGGENWVTGLEITRDTSFAIVSTWATAGAGSVAGAAYAAGSVALLKESAGAVGRVTANPAKAMSLNDARNMAVNVGVAALGGAFSKGEIGKKIISGAGSVLCKKAGSMGLSTLSTVGSKTLEGWMARVMQGVGSSVVEEAAKQGFKQLRSDSKPQDIYNGIATKALAAAVFGPFEEALKATNLAPTVTAAVRKKWGDKAFVIVEKGLNVELIPKKQEALMLKFLSGVGGDAVEKLALEAVAN